MNQQSSGAPSKRTRVRRLAERAHYNQKTLYEIIDAAYLCNIAFNDGESTHCIPTACWRQEDYLYVHGSNGSRLTKVLDRWNPGFYCDYASGWIGISALRV